MDDAGHLTALCSQYHGHRHEAAFGKYHVRLQLPDDANCFAVALQDLEGVGEVLRVEIPAQLAGRDTVVGNLELCDEFFLDSVIGAHIGNIVAELAKPRQQCDIGRHMSGSSAAGQKNSFQNYTSVDNCLRLLC